MPGQNSLIEAGRIEVKLINALCHYITCTSRRMRKEERIKRVLTTDIQTHTHTSTYPHTYTTNIHASCYNC